MALRTKTQFPLYFLLFALGLFSAGNHTSLAQANIPEEPPVYVISRDANEHNLPLECLYVFSDTTHQLSFKDAQEKSWLFQPINTEFRIEAGKSYWVKFRAQNRLLLDQNWIFFAARAFHLEFYEPDIRQNGYIKRENGRLVAYPDKDIQGFIDYGNPVRITTPKNTVQTYYFKVFSEKQFFVSDTFKPRIIPQETFFREVYFANLIGAFFLGTLFVMAIYNLLVYLVIKDRVYLYYVGFITFGMLFYAYFYGLAFEWLWPSFPTWDVYSFLFLLAVTFFCWVQFTRLYLQTKEAFPRIDQWLILIAYANFLPVLFAFYEMLQSTPPNHLFKLVQSFQNLMNLFNLVAIVWVSGYVWLQKNDAPSRIFALANFAFIIGSILLALRFFELAPENDLVNNGAQIGFFFQVILFSLGLADRIKLLRERIVVQQLENERLARQKELEKQRLMEEKNQELEYKVKERTEEILQQNKEIIHQTEVLQKQKEELEKVNHLKDKLFSIISHDLRSPFRTLRSMLGLASRGFVTKEEFVELSRQMEDTVNSATTLLENLLSWAKNQIHGIEVKATSFALQDLIAENCSLVQFQATKKEISIKNQVTGQFKPLADEEMTNLVLRNLLSNAIKFTPNGGTVKITASEKNGFIETEVNDTGVGIPEEHQKKLFLTDHFTTSGTAREKGSGLGLNLCKEFAEKMGGKLWFNSSVGKGTSFYFTLPKAED